MSYNLLDSLGSSWIVHNQTNEHHVANAMTRLAHQHPCDFFENDEVRSLNIARLFPQVECLTQYSQGKTPPGSPTHPPPTSFKVKVRQ
jgi:hypothetical protein